MLIHCCLVTNLELEMAHAVLQDGVGVFTELCEGQYMDTAGTQMWSVVHSSWGQVCKPPYVAACVVSRQRKRHFFTILYCWY